MQRLALLVAYDGSHFHGWQIQDHCETVQDRLQRVLSQIAQRPIKVYGAGRTDAGVHAFNQVAHADVPVRLPLDRLRRSVNSLAAPGVVVKNMVPVPDSFHARHSATGKIYRYHLFNRPYPSVFGRDRCWWIKTPLDLSRMESAALHLQGTHDFSAFRASECAAKSPVRTLHRIVIEPGDWPDATVRIAYHASGFLQHMARILTGTLVAVGMGRLTPEALPGILERRDRTGAAMTAPGRGLHLLRVFYDGQRFPTLRELGAMDPPTAGDIARD